MKALITGASSGIGRDIAKNLSKRGYDLVITARREERLLELKNELATDVIVIPADLSKKEECLRLYGQTKNEDISVLINNAGYGVFGAFDKTGLPEEIDMLDVNIISAHILMKLFLKDFIAENRGYILNVASSAAFLPGPLFSSYYASKAYVLRLTQAVSEELRRAGKNVSVSALCPGPVDTEFNKTAGVQFGFGGLSSPSVADYAVKKMFAKKTVIVPGATMKFARFFSKLLPDSLLAKTAYNLQNKKQ